MRPTDSAYDRTAAAATLSLLDTLRLTHKVEGKVTGAVEVDGKLITSDAWDRMAMSWDGTADGLEDLGWEAAAEAMRDAEEDAIKPGDRVETGEGATRYTGTVESVDDGTATVWLDGGVICTYPLSDLMLTDE